MSPATSVSTRTKIQLRSFALTTTVLIAVIFILGPCLQSPSGQRLAADAPFDERLQDDRDHDDEPKSELGVEGVDAGRDDAGVDRADDVGGDERADDRAGAAEHRRAAEEDRRDGVEEKAVARRRPEIIAVDRGHEPGEDRGDADEHEGARLHRHGVDAHQPGAGRIVADQEHMGAEAGAVEQDPEDDENGDHPQGLNREAEHRGAQKRVHLRKFVGGQRHAGAVHQHELEAAIEERGADGDDERGNIELGDQEAVQQSARRAGRERANEADPPRRPAIGGGQTERGRAERHDRGEREVDLAGDDDEGQGERDDAELRRRLREGAIDVEVGEHGRGRDDEGEPHRQPDADNAELAAVPAQRRGRRNAVVNGTVRNCAGRHQGPSIEPERATR